MTNRKVWIITIILLIVYLFVDYEFFLPVKLFGKTTSYEILSHLSISVFLVFFIVLLIVPLLALIPFRKMAYSEKFVRLVPFVTSTVLIVLIASFGQVIYQKIKNKVELVPSDKYEDIHTSSEVDCTQIHNGKFETENVFIERIGTKQLQIDKKTGHIKEYSVEWKSDCEYLLTSLEDSSSKLKIKIVSVNPQNYECFIISGKNASDYPNYLSVKRIE
ncbi:MAG: hypothetical protein K2Q22_11135 [Cytophagales bacterium]|nr:hypothetical protein [Cytophagales bacterium]